MKGRANKYRFTIIVLTYKASYDIVRLTIDSIISQKFKGFELIISEDGSESDWMEAIENYLQEKNFFDYKIRKNKENLGTVKNYYEALKIAEGKFVKPLGAGDYLYHDMALQKMYDFLEENHYCLGFGRIYAYRKAGNGIEDLGEYYAPKNLNLYRRKSWKMYSAIDILMLRDWISGVAIFGTRKSLIHYVGILRDVSKYSEDICQIFILGDRKRICFLDDILVRYEVGTGVSTKKGMNKFKKALMADIDNSISVALKQYKHDKLYCFLLRLGQTKDSVGKEIIRKLFAKIG